MCLLSFAIDLRAMIKWIAKTMPSASKSLPKPNVQFDHPPGEVTIGNVRAFFCNPIYVGLGPFPRIVDDETWVRAAAKAIEEYGAEQWLVNLLATLREYIGGED